MSLIASGVSTFCGTQLVPPSSVRARKPPSPPTQPRLLSRKKTVFRSWRAGPTRVAVQPCWALTEHANTTRQNIAVNNRVCELCTDVSPGLNWMQKPSPEEPAYLIGFFTVYFMGDYCLEFLP